MTKIQRWKEKKVRKLKEPVDERIHLRTAEAQTTKRRKRRMNEKDEATARRTLRASSGGECCRMD